MARTTAREHPTAKGAAEERPLHWRIAAELLGELRDGTLPPGERLPSERQLAAHFRVSRETVRRALEALRRDGPVATDRRGSHATPTGPPVGAPSCPTFPVGARTADPDACDRATVTGETPPEEHATALGLAPRRLTLTHRRQSAAADGTGLRTAVTSFSAVALAEVEELSLPHCLNGVGDPHPRPRRRLVRRAAAAGLRLNAAGRAEPAPPRHDHPVRGRPLCTRDPARPRPVRTPPRDHRPARGRRSGRARPRVHPAAGRPSRCPSGAEPGRQGSLRAAIIRARGLPSARRPNSSSGYDSTRKPARSSSRRRSPNRKAR